MIIVLFLVCVGMLVLGSWLCEEGFEASVSLTICGVCGMIAVLIAAIFIFLGVSEIRVIDPKIAMYEEENYRIETQIAECVRQYQEYEKGTFAELAPKDAVTMVSLYPDLKSDTLVAKQIEAYISNNEKIKELKEQKINGDVYRWWAYFGSSAKEGGAE